MKIDELLELPWSWVGPMEVDDDGDRHFELRIDELPDFFVAGQSVDEVKREAVSALRAFLQSHLDYGDEIPYPQTSSWRIFLTSSRDDARPRAQSEATCISFEDREPATA